MAKDDTLIDATHNMLLHYECIDEDCKCGGMYSILDVENGGSPACSECGGEQTVIGVVLSASQSADAARRPRPDSLNSREHIAMQARYGLTDF